MSAAQGSAGAPTATAPIPTPKNRRSRFAQFVRDSLVISIFLDLAVAAGFAIAGLAAGNLFAAAVILVIALVLQVLHRWRSIRHDRSVSALEAELTSAQGAIETLKENDRQVRGGITRTTVGLLRTLAAQHQMSARDRVTLYVRADGGLRAIGRYSRDTEYTKTGDHTRAAIHETTFGLIGRALRTGQRQIATNAPLYERDAVLYVQWQRTNFRSLSNIDELRMKSRCYDIVPIYDSGEHREVIGVLASESTQTRSAAVTAVSDNIVDDRNPMTEAIREMLQLHVSTLGYENGNQA